MVKRVKCEVWSRIVGYLRPVDQWNEAKQNEFEDRRTFDLDKIVSDPKYDESAQSKSKSKQTA